MSVNYNFVTEVQSESNPKKAYTVKLRDDGSGGHTLTCNCPSWIFNRRGTRTCKHTELVKDAGMPVDKEGRFILGQACWHKNNTVAVYCKMKDTDLCEECQLRFMCFTDRYPEFSLTKLKNIGMIKDEE